MNETFLDLRGCKLNLRRQGQGEPLLFLHGAQGIPGSMPALDALAQHFEVLVPDHPGFGRSDTPDGIDDVPDLAFFYLDLLAALGLTRVHLVGQSIGGWIALEMAIRSTACLRSLTLASSAGIRVDGVPRSDMFICRPDELARLLFAGAGWSDWLAQWDASPEMQDLYDRNRFAAAKYSWQPRLCNPKLAKWLHRIDIPTRILWGAEDNVIPPAYAAALAGLIPGAAVTMLADCGHLPQIEQPAAFVREVAGFISGLPR